MTALRRLQSFAWACGAAIALATAFSACGGNSNTSTAPTITATPQPELFEGSLNVGGFAFFSFNVQATGAADVMLASVTTSAAPGTSINVVLGMAIGSPLGTDCVISTSVLAAPALQSPLVSNLTAGTYCVRVYDVGNLTVPVNFAIRIVHT